MIHRDPPQLSARARRALRCFSLLLVPALAPKTTHGAPRARPAPGWALTSPDPEPTPYLAVTGAVPLRFQAAPPPPDLVTKPAAGAPPTPPLTPTESSVAQANTDALQSAVTVHPPAATAAKLAPTPAPSSLPPQPPPQPILPDDSRPAVRPEDFLPFFQFPATARKASEVNVIAPALPPTQSGSPVPPSSATYTQTPK